MRTTITIPDELAKAVLKQSGEKTLGAAVRAVLDDHLRLKKRLELIDYLFENKVPHDYRKIKAARRRNAWSS
jgi:Arc/MetJ family transcription regulator